MLHAADQRQHQRTGKHLAAGKKSGPKKPTVRKTCSRATTRSTAGPGYQFEDLSAAHLLVKMMLGRPLPGVGLGATQLQFQADAIGWRIDDLLVTASDDTARRHLALSCKSNLQVTANGLPADFVNRAWTQWRAADAGPMDRKSDTLALVTRGRHNAFDPLWADIVQWCGAGDDAVAIAHIRKSAKHTKVFESIKRPAAGVEATDAETVELIKHLAIVPLDFQLEPSRDLEDGIEWCRDLVASGSRADAEKLWNELVRLASATRVVGGTITLEGLWAHLRQLFSLKARPDFATSWRGLASLTEDYKAGVSTALSAGHVVARQAERTNLGKLIEEQTFTLVLGESGSGKSALVKLVLDGQQANQIWLGPEQLAAATSDTERTKLQLTHPLGEILVAAPAPSNVLVIDAAEKLTLETLVRVRALLEKLVPLDAGGSGNSWKVVIVTQADGWPDRAVALLGQRTLTPFEVGLIGKEEVRTALLSTRNLRWLADDAQSIDPLRNLRTLGWVMEAEAALSFTQADMTSPPAMADRIWEYWTAGRVDAQRLLMRLSEREANFERSFPIAELEAGDAAAFDGASTHLPLRRNGRNSLTFEHDLAADWSRFQWLKQVADSEQWAPFAQSPLWSAALRLLGQFLLRQPVGATTEWDVALAAAEARADKSATDLLLDALCLDPEADRFLGERADVLFNDNGALLNRLLRRFLHSATTPRIQPGALKIDPGLGIYLEASLRSPIIGRWPPMARFLHAHIAELGKLASPIVSKVCEIWLTTTPPDLGEGIPMPYRKEFAEIALANARTVQVQKASSTLYLGDGWEPLYSAALAGAADLPEEIGAWILEQVQRRPLSSAIAERIAEVRKQKADERAERLRTDPEFKARSRAQRRRSSPSMFISSSVDLPPWPLGPEDRIDHNFQKVAVGGSALAPFMRARPELAAEALLALLIEGNPKEEYSDSLMREKIGLEFDGTAYPTAFWKSPFFSFLQIAPDVALTTIIQLVEFCTERWVANRARRGEQEPPGICLLLPDGEKRFVGDSWLFDWTQANDMGTGQLHCALNALERWLTQQLEEGKNIEPHLVRILRESRSVALLGLLTNVAKFRPSLLEGVLRPLLSGEEIYWYDQARVQRPDFEAFAWVREGNAIFEMARDWAFAAYRQQHFLQLAVNLVKASTSASDYVQAAIKAWPEYEHPKDAIESGILRAQLDPARYRKRVDEASGEEIEEFVLPDELSAQIDAFQAQTATTRRELLLPYRLAEILGQPTQLPVESAQQLAAMLLEPAGEDGETNPNAVAIAATLVARAGAWLIEHADLAERVRSILREAADSVADTHEEIRGQGISADRQDLEFAAHGVMHLWIAEGADRSWDEPLLRILTSGNRPAVAVIASVGFRERVALGSRWWRLLQIGLLWSALSMLSPDYGDEGSAGNRWSRWLQWLRSRRLADDATASSIDPIEIWNRLARIERVRWRRQAADRSHWRAESERYSHGFQTDFLASLFGWLIGDNAQTTAADLDLHRTLLLQFWDYEQRWCAAGRNDRDEYRLPHQFGYHVLDRLAWFAASDPSEEARSVWQSVLQLNSDAHVLIERFLSVFLLNRGPDADLFVRRWKEMIAYALEGNWAEGRNWFYGQRMLRRVLGFGFEGSLNQLPDAAATIASMRDLYERWALAHVAVEDENVAAFCHFLTSDIGAPIRIDGLKWLAVALEAKQGKSRWDRDGAGDAMVGLLDASLTKNASDLTKDEAARSALVKLAAELAARHVTAALALQERIKALR